ncbi:hypothetical protein, partial [Bacteroides cellulosilyticus]|uniref:hypothetical protein n=1 Tax=Bacteroides cellulosilyticus TaxID=246787 RepID=UPI00234C1E43
RQKISFILILYPASLAEAEALYDNYGQGYEENPKFSQKAADVHPAMHYQHFSVSRMKKKKKE